MIKQKRFRRLEKLIKCLGCDSLLTMLSGTRTIILVEYFDGIKTFWVIRESIILYLKIASVFLQVMIEGQNSKSII